MPRPDPHCAGAILINGVGITVRQALFRGVGLDRLLLHPVEAVVDRADPEDALMVFIEACKGDGNATVGAEELNASPESWTDMDGPRVALRRGQRYLRIAALFHHVAHVVGRDSDPRAAHRLDPDGPGRIEHRTPKLVVEYRWRQCVVDEAAFDEAVQAIFVPCPETSRLPKEVPVQPVRTVWRYVQKPAGGLVPAKNPAAGKHPEISAIVVRQPV